MGLGMKLGNNLDSFPTFVAQHSAARVIDFFSDIHRSAGTRNIICLFRTLPILFG